MNGTELVLSTDPHTIGVGWWHTSAAAVIDACPTWDGLDELDAQLRALVALVEATDAARALELEKARRIVDRRRGELLGPPHPVGRHDPLPRGEGNRIHATTASRYRRIAAFWPIVLERLLYTEERRDVTQRRVLQVIAEARGRRAVVVDEPAPAVAARKASIQNRRTRIRELAAEGASVRQIAIGVGLHEQTIRDFVARESIDVPGEKAISRTRRHSANRILEQIVFDAESLTADNGLIVLDELDPARLGDWIARLRTARTDLSRLIHLLEQHGGSYAATAEPCIKGTDNADAGREQGQTTET